LTDFRTVTTTGEPAWSMGKWSASGGVMAGRQHAEVVDEEQVTAADPGAGAGDWPVAARLRCAAGDARRGWRGVTRIDPNVTS
jgi:hypothetical protein